MGIKMVAVDMDGTFLDKNSKYNRERFNYLYKQMKQRNIRFVVASGNPCKQLKMQFPQIEDECIYISENGGYIVEGNDDLFVASFPQEDVTHIIKTLKEMPNVLSWVCTKTQSYTLSSMDEKYYQQFLPYFPGVKRIEDYCMIDQDIMKFALYVSRGNVKQIVNDFTKIVSENVHVVDSGHDCIDLIPSHVNKGRGILYLMDRYGINKDEVMAFGDAFNDYEMLKCVTYGYAMNNATNEFKDCFDYIASSNNEEGVLEVIETYLNTGKFINLK